MARRRYQKGRLFLRGKNPVWVGRWREDVVNPDGSLTRVEKSAILGTKTELPTRRLATRGKISRESGARANAAMVLKPLEATAQLGKADAQRSIVVIKNVGRQDASKMQSGSGIFASVAA